MNSSRRKFINTLGVSTLGGVVFPTMLKVNTILENLTKEIDIVCCSIEH